MQIRASTVWMVLLTALVTGCYTGDYGMSICAYDLSQAPPAKRAANTASAQADAKAWCVGGTAYQSPCPGGGVSVVGNSLSGHSGEAWWFDASGQLLGYESWSAPGHCADQHYGTAPDCPATASDISLCGVASDAISDSGATDSGQTAHDVADGGSDNVPDALDIAADVSAADIPTDNTTCASQADCAADKWCNVSGCGFQLGLCLARPTDCSGQFGPVCGCDGKSYDSACHAQKAGKSIAAYSAPCLGTGCAPACVGGSTCVDCASAGVQCLQPGKPCVGGK